MNKAAKPANSTKTRMKENPPNPATGATTAPSRRQPLGEVTTEANNVEDMAKKMQLETHATTSGT